MFLAIATGHLQDDKLEADLDESKRTLERVQLQALLARVVQSTAPEGDACVDDDAGIIDER